MRITRLDILSADIGGPGQPRIYLFVRLQTDAGIVGFGEPSCVGKEQAVVGAIRDLEHFVVGADPLAIERLLGDMTRTVIWRGGRFSAAVSASASNVTPGSTVANPLVMPRTRSVAWRRVSAR